MPPTRKNLVDSEYFSPFLAFLGGIGDGRKEKPGCFHGQNQPQQAAPPKV